MKADRIIGRVGANVLFQRLADSKQGDGRSADSKALFRLDQLAPNQIAAIVREVIANPVLSAIVDLRIPASLVMGEDLPIEVLTDQNAGAARNATTTKEALLTANGHGQNLSDTLGYVTALGAKEFKDNEDAWVEATCHVGSIAPTPEDRLVFKAAMRALIASQDLSLIQLADFCEMIIEGNAVRGEPIRDAIGWSLPCVGLPRDSSYFSNPKSFGQGYLPWRKAFEKLFATRRTLLERLKPTGQPMDAVDMLQRLDENSASIDAGVRVTLEAFINAPVGNFSVAEEVALLEWEKDGVHFIFEKPRERQLGLADSTLMFFDHDCSDTDVLTVEWRKHLDDLKARERRSDWNDDDEAFFELHRRYIESNKNLHSRWEKVIFGKPIECLDFLDGFTGVAHRLVVGAGDAQGERFLRLTVNKGRKEWRERFNHDVGTYFSAMYRGLKELMGSKVQWRVEKMGTGNLPDPLFHYREYFQAEKEIKRVKPIKPSVSLSRTSLQIKFEVALIELLGSTETVIDKTQLLWNYRPDSIGLSMVEDMLRLQNKGCINATEVPRRLVSKKGGIQSISLLDTGTLEATFSRDAGSLVPPVTRLKVMSKDIRRRIDELATEGRISTDQKKELREAWVTFDADYVKALDDFISLGLHGESVLKQADSFAAFLRALSIHARGDVCRSKLVSEVLTIGTVKVLGEQPCLIIPPWHPERMKALAVKTRRVAGLVTHMLSNDNVQFGDRGIFFREFSEELAHPFYPEIAVTMRGGASILVSESSTCNGYSILEIPVRVDDESMSDVQPGAAAKQVTELLEKYVGLQPHEANNLSVLLYNADAAELPLAVVRELANLQSEADFQCNVAVRHRDAAKLRRVYAELVTKSGDDPDLPVVSETSENFISKLRIAVAPASSTPTKGGDGFRTFDVAFLHDVVSRTAAVEWLPVDWTNERPSLEHAPSRWSYRSVSGENELKSTTFLTCPRQTASGWAYVGAVASVVRQTDSVQGANVLPARRISLQNESLRATLDDAHELAEWVATYDELLDKRQLQANGVTVVRYRRASTNGRNMIVSSTSELRLLGVLAKRRLGELSLPFTPEQFIEVADRMKKDALTVSGDIVLRAAKRGVSTGEMLGLVLSRYLLDHEFKGLSGAAGRQAFSVFFLLDDYADWLAQKESRIADILGLCVEERDGVPHLHIAVIESKYVSVNGAAEARRSSKAQLLATLSTFRAALFGDPGRLDRDVWLSRLSDLLLDADIPPGCSGLLERTRSKLREGEALISLRGYSHVFIHTADPGAGASSSEQTLVDETDNIQAWQEVFDRQELRELVEAYARKDPPASIRAKLGPHEPWLTSNPRPPAARVAWTAMMELLANGHEPAVEDATVVEQTSVKVPVKAVPETLVSKPISEPAAISTPIHGPDNSVIAGEHLSKLIAEKSAHLAGDVDQRGAWAEESTKKLKAALNGYGLQAAVLGTRLTPNGCLVRLAGSDRLRVEDIEAKRMQLLTTHAINLVTVQPKPGEIVVTIAGTQRQAVSLWDVWAKRSINRNVAGINTSFVLGLQEINGHLLYLNFGTEFGGLATHDPHSLVAGATGSGKSVLIQALLLDIAATNPKELAQIILIDPKMGVDYAALGDLPHMREPIITTKERSGEVLSSLVEEMETRYRKFAAARTRDLPTYNSKATPEERLPMVFLIHDEFADWMLDDEYKSSVSAAVQRLGVKARAAGIHLIFAAQRPDKDVMPMQLRENLGNRLILKVASEATSKIALDRSGAELLLGRGHMAAKLNGEQGLVFAQAPFLSDQDIELAVAAIRSDNSTQ
jgi:S-DNA-T family DNA segregation ATPase FtsK/SpoIIIE